MDKIYVKSLNELIEYHGSGFGPAINNLLLYGPFDKRVINNSNLALLKDRQKVIEDAYKQSIVPKIRLVADTLTLNEVKMPKDRVKLSSILKVRSSEYIRCKIRSSFKDQFNISPETCDCLNSNNKLKENHFVKFAFINNYMISYRQKEPVKLEKKYNNLYDSIIKSDITSFDRGEFEEFLLTAMKASYKYWNEFSYFDKIYGDLNEFMIGDDFGLKIVDLNQERADKRMDYLANLNGDLKIHGFNVIKERFDDHRKRVNSLRPGGIHYTLTDLGLNNFPIEVQYQGIKSLIYDKYGPNSHDLYTYRNKKSQF